jgi:hypothetical protein
MTAPTTPPRPEPSGRDWTSEATEAIESLVLTVKDKTTVPATTIARGVVYGIVIAALGVAAAICLAIAGVRFLTVYLPVGRVNHGHHRVWVADLLLGLLFTIAGLFCWSRRATKEPS